MIEQILNEIYEDEFPDKIRFGGKFNVKNIEKSTRKKCMEWFMASNVGLIILSLFFLIYGIYAYS